MNTKEENRLIEDNLFIVGQAFARLPEQFQKQIGNFSGNARTFFIKEISPRRPL